MTWTRRHVRRMLRHPTAHKSAADWDLFARSQLKLSVDSATQWARENPEEFEAVCKHQFNSPMRM